MNKPNWMLDIPAEDYHAAARRGEWLSSHMLAKFRRCPLDYHRLVTGAEAPTDTPSLKFGRAAHTFILERAAFAERYLVCDGPVNPKTGEVYGKATKAYKEWAAMENRAIVSQTELAQLEAMKAGIMLNDNALRLLTNGFSEATVRSHVGGVAVQARPDWYDPVRGVLVDLKTTEDIERFRYDARKYGYLHQMAFYQAAICAAGGLCEFVYFIVIEKGEPFRCGVWAVEQGVLNAAHADNLACIGELKTARETGVWKTRYEDIQIFTEED